MGADRRVTLEPHRPSAPPALPEEPGRPCRVLLVDEPVSAALWVFAWRTAEGLIVTCEHVFHLRAVDANHCRDRLGVETGSPPWTPLGPRPA